VQKIRAYLQLVRFPAVFTAMADVVLGFLLNHAEFGSDWQRFAFLLASSTCLYLSGMAFNDYFDRAIDAQERPNRPIPSGRVSPLAAAVLASVLMAAGIAFATVAARQSLYVAVGLALCVIAYDAILKKTPLGPVAMGGCRFLNVMLGASAFNTAEAVWTTPQLYVASALGIYIAGVTWFARTEATTSHRAHLIGAAAVLNAGLLLLVAFVLRELVPVLNPIISRFAGPAMGNRRASAAGILLAVVIVSINRRIVAALFDPVPGRVQQAVKVMLLSLVSLDAAIVYFQTGEPIYTLATLALLAPAMLLGRFIFVT
jgi:4-hydroxybenzoate polyprenyltransferase